jgi:predicted RNA-binding protein with PIN domain
MAYLIDGNNFLGYLFPQEIRSPAGRAALVSRLLAFQKVKKSRIYLVFDGPPDDRLTEIGQHRPKFSVLFPPPGQKADDLIQEMIDRQTDFRQFFLITSDRELRTFAKARGAKTLSVKEFAVLLKKILREHRAAAELERKPGSSKPTPFELQLWLDAFGK